MFLHQINVCEKRDGKGLYKKARKGEIKQFTGIDDPYEIPKNPEITIDTSNITIEESVNKVLKYFNSTYKVTRRISQSRQWQETA